MCEVIFTMWTPAHLSELISFVVLLQRQAVLVVNELIVHLILVFTLGVTWNNIVSMYINENIDPITVFLTVSFLINEFRMYFFSLKKITINKTPKKRKANCAVSSNIYIYRFLMSKSLGLSEISAFYKMRYKLIKSISGNQHFLPLLWLKNTDIHGKSLISSWTSWSSAD